MSAKPEKIREYRLLKEKERETDLSLIKSDHRNNDDFS